MGSPNGNCVNRHHSKSMMRKFTCSECGKKYAMLWAHENHIKHCIDEKKNI